MAGEDDRTTTYLARETKVLESPLLLEHGLIFDLLQLKLSLTRVRDAGQDLRHSYLGTYVGTYSASKTLEHQDDGLG